MLNSSIPLQVQPLQLPQRRENPINMLAQVMQVQGLQDQSKINALDLQSKQRAIEQENVLSKLYAEATDPTTGKMDRAKLIGGAATQGLGSRIPAITKTFAEQDSAERQAEKAKLEIAKERTQITGQRFGTIRQNPTIEGAFQVLDSLQQDGIMPPELVAQTKQQLQAQPDRVGSFVEQTFNGSMTASQQLEQIWKAKNFDLDVEKFGETKRSNRAQEATSAGQLRVAQGNLTLRGQELEQSRNQPRGQFIETVNGYVLADPRSGNVRPVMGADGQPLKGKAADRSLNETQAKANLFGTRMKEADRILGELEGKYSPMAVNAKMGADAVPVIGGLTGYAANKMLTAEGQQAEQAQRDFINAVLRRESGAAIASSEFANANKQYFPEPGDTPEKIAQKARNRRLAIQGLEVEVPGGFRGAPSLTNTGQQGGSGGRSASGQVGEAVPQIIDFGSLK